MENKPVGNGNLAVPAIPPVFDEYKERNDYARSIFNNFITWFIFFLTVNYTAIGWFLSLLLQGKVKHREPIYAIAIFFFFQNVLGFLACLAVHRIFINTHQRISEMLQRASGQADLGLSPVPVRFYGRAITLMCWTIATLGVFWILLIIITAKSLINIEGNC
jgi:hypothetical protein